MAPGCRAGRAPAKIRLAARADTRHRATMDFDALLQHFFGTTELDDLAPAAIEAGAERVRIAFGTETEPGRRFALWTLLHALGDAPDPATAFKDGRLRLAAEDYARAAARIDRESF